jgi:hypothetical protein
MTDTTDYTKMSIPEIGRMLRQLKDEKKELTDAASIFTKAIDNIELNVLPERMEDEDILTVKIDGAGRLQTKDDAWVSVLAANKPDFFEWLNENGHGSLIKNDIHAGTLKAWAKGMIKDGNELPVDVRFEAYTRAVLVT